MRKLWLLFFCSLRLWAGEVEAFYHAKKLEIVTATKPPIVALFAGGHLIAVREKFASPDEWLEFVKFTDDLITTGMVTSRLISVRREMGFLLALAPDDATEREFADPPSRRLDPAVVAALISGADTQEVVIDRKALRALTPSFREHMEQIRKNSREISEKLRRRRKAH